MRAARLPLSHRRLSRRRGSSCREVKTHSPEASCCPGCGGMLREFGEGVSEVLQYVPESFRVIRHVRPKSLQAV